VPTPASIFVRTASGEFAVLRAVQHGTAFVFPLVTLAPPNNAILVNQPDGFTRQLATFFDGAAHTLCVSRLT
jgi:hypothetical protein